jgi:hypothetical protein
MPVKEIKWNVHVAQHQLMEMAITAQGQALREKYKDEIE